MEKSEQYFQHVQRADLHAESAVLEIAQAMTKLQERQRHPQGDERVHEEPAEDVIRHAPQRAVVAYNDFPELHPERRRI